MRNLQVTQKREVDMARPLAVPARTNVGIQT